MAIVVITMVSFLGDLTTLYQLQSYILSNDNMIMNAELGRMWKEEIVGHSKVFWNNFPGEPKGNNENHSQDDQTSGRELNPKPPNAK